ncbi:restriction endonuclease subunit S [Limosilactobacillus mucosae]|uniref:restriction endonuclease subunit S n=3 Tax=Limosilactobacillus mucosae TaxID=97478 RepID=UPI000D6B7519|nr:restriction endonuclease subunit S [Limosilactobacillus mucosae]
MYGKLDFLHAAFGIVPKELDKYESTADSPAFDIIDGNPKFLLESFLRKEFYLRNGQRANGSRKAKRIHEKDFLEMPILVPYKSEQTKIGNLINSLDKTITLHEEQHRQLERLKKALLQKMFADETGYPALRFKGFTAKWEQRKLGETVVNIVAGGDINKAELLSKGKYPVYANALTNNGIVGYYASQYRIAAPAVTVTGRGDIGIAKARDINFTPVVRLLAISSQHNNYFLENLINTHRSFAESTGVPQLTVPQLSNYKLYFPQKINEEVFIGKLFKKMDHLTTLHQHKIDNLKRLKRALLQKMFV